MEPEGTMSVLDGLKGHGFGKLQLKSVGPRPGEFGIELGTTSV